MQVTQIMTPDVIAVEPDTPINEVARLMTTHGVSGVPVVDPASGALLGMITELEMIERQADFDAPVYSTFLDAMFVIQGRDSEEQLARILATRADQLMERTVYSIREDATIQEVASLMFERKVNPVPVISMADELIGMVSRSDIIRLMARDFTEPGGEYPGASEAVAGPTPDLEPEAIGPVATAPAETAPIAPASVSGHDTIVVTSDDLADGTAARTGPQPRGITRREG
ncbi:MAG: CBS domain-containing protein [Chloroflexota bacterium]|nr:CBS domain-containing protein [Chloroflexota bacterium]